jgi:hypothetical protein
MHFHIDSDCGRIGPFWWVNADTRPRTYNIPGIGNFLFIQEGSSGWNKQAQIILTPLEPFDP